MVHTNICYINYHLFFKEYTMYQKYELSFLFLKK